MPRGMGYGGGLKMNKKPKKKKKAKPMKRGK